MQGGSFPLIVEWNGQRFVASSGKRRYLEEANTLCGCEPIVAEYVANQVYSFFGVPVPRSKLYLCKVQLHWHGDPEPRLVPLLLTDYIEGPTWHDYSQADHPTLDFSMKRLQAGAAVDFLVGNTQILGGEKRNVIVSGGICYRVELSGSSPSLTKVHSHLLELTLGQHTRSVGVRWNWETSQTHSLAPITRSRPANRHTQGQGEAAALSS